MSALSDGLDTIRAAIKSHSQLTFTFSNRHREVCPHMLGRKDGVWKILVWQINDESEHGFEPGAQRWRCFEVSDILPVTPRQGQWHRGWTKGKRKTTCIDESFLDVAVSGAFAAEIR